MIDMKTKLRDDAILDNVARLLATENINIVRSNCKTASFNTETRVLKLPLWENLDDITNEMLVCHEVGHALFTPLEMSFQIQEQLKFPNAHHICNVVEDVRIEKKIKKLYPGTKRIFQQGYVNFYNYDFFGLDGRNPNDLNFIDRINLFFSVGSIVDIDFNDEEWAIVTKISNAETPDDVVRLAQEIYDYINRDKQERDKQESDHLEKDEEGEQPIVSSSPATGEEADNEEGEIENQFVIDINEEADPEDDIEDNIGHNEDDKNSGAGECNNDGDVECGGDNKEDLLPTTKINFDENLANKANLKDSIYYFTIGKNNPDTFVSYKKLLSQCEGLVPVFRRNDAPMLDKEMNKAVSYLSKEFEMKKKAKEYKKTKVTKTGTLNNKRLWAYQIKDDIFKSVEQHESGKNHGIIMLVDWSGSMAGCIGQTLEQTITFVKFCKMQKIPFQVMFFCTAVGRQHGRSPKPTQTGLKFCDNFTINPGGGSGIDNVNKFLLVELFNNKMSSKEMTDMIKFIRNGVIRTLYYMGSTPLNDSLLYMYNHVNKFKAEHNVEKLSFVALSDGESNRHAPLYVHQADKNYTAFVCDHSAKITQEINKYYGLHTSEIISMLKKKHDCKFIGFYIMGSKKRSFTYNVMYQFCKKIEVASRLTDKFVRNAELCSEETYYDKMFFVYSPNLNISHDNLSEVTSDMSIKKIARQFSKMTSKSVSSRVILSKFIDTIA